VHLASIGLHVFPLTPGTKVPTKGSAGLRDATTNLDQVNEWWRQRPDANIGVRTIGLAVIDLDLYHPEASHSQRRLLNRLEIQSLPTTATSRTGRGGRHYWYHLPDPQRRHLHSGYTSRLPISGDIVNLPHIDMKSAGGSYVVAPPSIVSGGPYAWIRRTGLALAPEWLHGPAPISSQPRRVPTIQAVTSSKQVAGILRVVAAAKPGQRNNLLNWGAYRLAGAVLSGTLSDQLARDGLLEAATRTGLTTREAIRTIRSAFDARGI
jgi:hypothetical protein